MRRNRLTAEVKEVVIFGKKANRWQYLSVPGGSVDLEWHNDDTLYIFGATKAEGDDA